MELIPLVAVNSWGSQVVGESSRGVDSTCGRQLVGYTRGIRIWDQDTGSRGSIKRVG